MIYMIQCNGKDLKRSSFRLGLSEFSKEKFGSFLLQDVVDWLALHQEWLEKKSDLWKAWLSRAGLDILFCWWNCCQGQGYCCPSDGCTAIANCRLGLLQGKQSCSLKIRLSAAAGWHKRIEDQRVRGGEPEAGWRGDWGACFIIYWFRGEWEWEWKMDYYRFALWESSCSLATQ